jgi:hypothetical protein
MLIDQNQKTLHNVVYDAPTQSFAKQNLETPQDFLTSPDCLCRDLLRKFACRHFVFSPSTMLVLPKSWRSLDFTAFIADLV